MWLRTCFSLYRNLLLCPPGNYSQIAKIRIIQVFIETDRIEDDPHSENSGQQSLSWMYIFQNGSWDTLIRIHTHVKCMEEETLLLQQPLSMLLFSTPLACAV